MTSIVGLVVEVVLVVTLVPVIAVYIASAQNLTTTEKTILGLATTFIILGLIYAIAKSSGIMGKK